MDCPRLAHQSGINTLDLAHYSQWVAETEAGQRVLAACLDLGIDVEFSLHVPTVFLPRELFEHDRTMFRMDDDGNRVPDANLCIHSERALEILCENAAKHAAIVRPTTHRYYYWVDDGQPMCRCPECRGLSDSEQALVVEHRILEALRRDDPEATLCHLAYQKTMQPPTQVKPQPGIFLQFAPIERNTLKPLTDADASLLPGWPSHSQIVQWLDANLDVFGSEGAQVLEYWLDNARHSGWKREQVREVPWDEGTFLEDLRVYAGRGVRHVRTYAVWLDEEYVTQYGLPPFDEYGRGLLRWRLVDGHAVEREDV